jgi:hypothetical protein
MFEECNVGNRFYIKCGIALITEKLLHISVTKT